MKRWGALAPLALFAAIAIAFAAALTRDPSAVPSTRVGKPLPAFDLPPLEGRTEGLATAHFNGEASLLNVFGSWCVSCRVEHPFLMQLAARRAAPIYGLNWKDEPGDGAAWLQRYGDPYARTGADRDGRAAIDLGVTGAPETFVIDRNGLVRYKHVGPIDETVWRSTLEPMLKRLNEE